MIKTKSVITYRGAVEGLQEKLYFERLKDLINNDDKFSKRVNFKFENSQGGSPTTVVRKAIKNSINTDNKNVAIYDRDFKNDFLESIKLAQRNKIIPAYSNQNFNYFLILHKRKIYKQTTKEGKYEKELKETYNLDKDCDLKNRETIEKILSQITLNDIKEAIPTIKNINEQTKQTQKQLANNIYEQPFLNIIEFLEDIFDKIK